MKWKVQISGDVSDLKLLSDSLKELSVRIVESGNAHFIEAEAFNAFVDPKEVSKAAGELALVLSGVARLAYGARGQFSTGHVVNVNADGTENCYVFLEGINVRCSVGVLTVSTSEGGETITIKPVDPATGWIKSAISNPTVVKALRLHGAGSRDWVDLYRLYEVIEGDIGGIKKVASLGYATEETLRRFKHTANSPSAIGDDARHGKESTQPPNNPLPLHEARSIIEAILHAWLREKGADHS